MHILSIDIGSSSVKYLVLKKKEGIRGKGIYPYSGEIEDLSAIIKDIRDKDGTNFDVKIAITTTEIVKRTFTIPTLPKEEIEEAVKWSLSKVLKESPDTYVFQYGPLGPVEEKGVRREEMFFVGAKREFIDMLIQIFENEGFKNISLLTDAAMAYIQIPRILREGNRSFAILDVGGRHTGLYIFKNGRLSFIREIFTAGESFSDALISGLDLTFEEAEKQKAEKGFVAETEPYLRSPFERLAGEIERTINVYNQRYPSDPLTHLYFTGRGSRIRGFGDKLTEALAVNVEPLSIETPVEDEYLLAYLLAYSTKVPNLLPAEKTGWKKEARLKRVGIGLSVITFLILFFLSYHLLSKLHSIELAIKTENQLISQKREFFSKNTGLSPNALKEIEETLSEAKKKDRTFVFLLKSLSGLTPENIYFKELVFEKEKQKNLYFVELKGVTMGEVATIEEPLLKLVMILEKQNVMKDLSIRDKKITEMGGRKVLEFVLKGTLEETIEI